MPYVRTVFYNFTKHETAFDFTSKGPFLPKGTNTKHTFFSCPREEPRILKWGFSGDLEPLSSWDQSCMAKANRSVLSQHVQLFIWRCSLIFPPLERQRAWRAPDLSALKLLITVVNLSLLLDSLKSAPPNGTGLPLHSHLAWQEVEEGRGKMKKKKTGRTKANMGESFRTPTQDGSLRKAGGWGGHWCLEAWLGEAFSNRVSGGRGVG